jgi:tetratricopeptide (TPR) repeat protein
MQPSSRRSVLIVAVSAPVITALIMGALIIRKYSERDSEEEKPKTAAGDTREAALFALRSAEGLEPDAMIRAADDADKAAGSPLVEAALVRARAARKRSDAGAERAAIERALALDASRPEAQLAKSLLAAEEWARAGAPLARVHAPDTTLAQPLLVPPAPAIDPSLDKFAGRAGEVVKLLKVFRAGGQPAEIAPIWTGLSSGGGVEDRLAFTMGVHSLRLGAPKDALLWLRTALPAAPADPARLRSTALAALLAGEAPEALDLLRRWSAAGGKPDPAEALGWWAVAARRLGNLGEARHKLDEASKLDPAWRGARGWLAYHEGDKKQALEDATARRESDPWARYLGALLHWDAGEVDAALEECATLLAGTPDHYEALVLQARGLTVRGVTGKAEEIWKHAQKLAAGRMEAKLGLAEFYATTGRREEAIAAYLEIHGLAVAHTRGAQLMLDLGRHAEALRWADLGVQRYPTDASVRVTMSRILHARLDHFGERGQLERASKLEPENEQIKKLLAECVAEMKRE